MAEALLLALDRPPRLVAASPASAHGGDRPAESYRLKRIWCLNVYQGHGELMWRNQRFAIRPGNMSLTAPDTDHHYVYRGPATLTWLHFLPDPSGEPSALPVMHAASALLPGVFQQAKEAASCWQDHPARAQALLWSVLWQLAGRQTSARTATLAVPVPVRRAMQHCDEHLGDPLLAGDLARIAGCSVTHLNRLFNAHRGTSAMGWLRLRRVERAQHLLCCSTKSAASIAAELGFVDLQHLNKSLRRSTGRGPRALRAESGESPDVEGVGHDVLGG